MFYSYFQANYEKYEYENYEYGIFQAKYENFTFY